MGSGGQRTRERYNAPVRASWGLERTFAPTQGSLCLECQPFACLDGLYAEADVLIALVCFLCRCNSRTLCRWRRASFRSSRDRLLSRAICRSALNAFGKSEILCVTGGLRFDAKVFVAQVRKFLGDESAGGALAHQHRPAPTGWPLHRRSFSPRPPRRGFCGSRQASGAPSRGGLRRDHIRDGTNDGCGLSVNPWFLASSKPQFSECLLWVTNGRRSPDCK